MKSSDNSSQSIKFSIVTYVGGNYIVLICSIYKTPPIFIFKYKYTIKSGDISISILLKVRKTVIFILYHKIWKCHFRLTPIFYRTAQVVQAPILPLLLQPPGRYSESQTAKVLLQNSRYLYRGLKMKQKRTNLSNCRSRYLSIIYKITKYQLAGKQPPAELLQKARDAAINASIPREELENIQIIPKHLDLK